MIRLGLEETQTPYESGTQKARSLTEAWAAAVMFCPACGHNDLASLPVNNPAGDLVCPSCREEYELKATKSRFRTKVVDGAYETMRRRIAVKDNPSFLFMQYSLERNGVTDLFAVPRHFFHSNVLEQRRPLGPSARRAGWIGCNIMLERIPEAGKIKLIEHGVVRPTDEIVAHWRRTIFLEDEKPAARGWLLDVLRCIESIGLQSFTLEDVYRFEPILQAAYPGNQNVRPKIRQQLQVLRDAGLLEFVARGRYCLT